MLSWRAIILCVTVLLPNAYAECTDEATCVLITKCKRAMEAIDVEKIHHGLQNCGWEGFMEKICCPKEQPRPKPRFGSWSTHDACENFTNSAVVKVGGHILEGEPVKPGELPHMAALGYSGNGSELSWGHCGGALISYDYVITAAHCLQLLGSDTLDVTTVRLGKVDLTGNSDNLTAQDYKIISVHGHPGYHPGTKHNDIALLRLEKPVTITEYICPACLDVNPQDPKKFIIVSGWGFTTPKGDPSNILLKTQLKALDIDVCSESYNKLPSAKEIINSQLCAISNDTKGRDTCTGDSGGPAQIIEGGVPYIVGITSFGVCKVKPGIYTRVSKYIDWIESIVWP